MNKKLQQKFDRIEKIKTDIFNKLDHLSNEQVNTPKAPGKWSPAQVIYHVAFAEKLSVNYMIGKLQNEEKLSTSGIKSFLKSVLLIIILKLPLKYKAPKVVADVPSQVNITHIKEDWKNTRQEVHDFLENLPDSYHNKEIFDHPNFKGMNIFKTLDFMIAHLEHHLPQV